jgi:Ser-tRNA(Ala) deacylase AlaX
MNPESQIKQIEETFNLLSRSKKLRRTYPTNSGVSAVNSKFEIKVDDSKVKFEKISGENDTSYKVSIKDMESNIHVFSVTVVCSKIVPESSISMNIAGLKIKDPEQVISILQPSVFGQILDKVNSQSNEIIKEKERVSALKSNPVSVADVLSRINKTRPNNKSKTSLGHKD